MLTVLLVIPANLAHLLLARHAICADHGELLHEAEAGVALDAAGTSVPAGTGRAIEQSAAGEHEHEHCAFASQGRERTLVGRSLSELTLERDAGPRLSVMDGGALPSTGEHLYQLAPKTSPPG